MVHAIDVWVQGLPILHSVVSTFEMLGVFFVASASLISIAQFLGALILRLWGITFRKKMILRLIALQIIALLPLTIVLPVAAGLTASGHWIFELLLFGCLFAGFNWGTMVLLSRWIKFEQRSHIIKLLVVNGIILAALFETLLLSGNSGLLLNAIPLVPLGLIFFVLNYAVFVKE